MNAETALVIGVIVLIIFFGGEPDLIDALVSYLSK